MPPKNDGYAQYANSETGSIASGMRNLKARKKKPKSRLKNRRIGQMDESEYRARLERDIAKAKKPPPKTKGRAKTKRKALTKAQLLVKFKSINARKADKENNK